MFNIEEYLYTHNKNNEYRLRLINHLKINHFAPIFQSKFFATGTGGNMQTYLVPKNDIIYNFNLSFFR